MRELAILTFVTLDGVMQAPKSPDEDRSGGFTRGGWADPHWDPVMEQVGREAMSAPYDVLFGRKTYDVFAAHASADHPMQNAVKFVATSNPQTLRWNNSRPITGDVAAGVARVKRQDDPLLQVHGSARLIQTLLAHDLIDEYRIWTFPAVVGSGKRLFEPGAPPIRLRLVESESGPSGVVMSVFRRSGC